MLLLSLELYTSSLLVFTKIMVSKWAPGQAPALCAMHVAQNTYWHMRHVPDLSSTQRCFLGVVTASVCFTEGSLGLVLISVPQALGFGLDPSAKQVVSVSHF